jgi:RimJ/RimL family protein N-acetyltransferase
MFLTIVMERPLLAHVAVHNHGSIRVLQKCGFVETGRGRADDGIEEVVFVLSV